MKVEIKSNGADNRTQVVVDGNVIFDTWNYNVAPYELKHIIRALVPVADVSVNLNCEEYVSDEDDIYE